jgi:hypothetical protein
MVMNDPMDDLLYAGHLTEALEKHFGPARHWSIRVKATATYFRNLRYVTEWNIPGPGNDAYGAFVACVVEALDERQTRSARRTYLINDYLGRALMRRFGQAPDEAVDVAWHTTLAAHGILGDDDFGTFMRAAASAWQTWQEKLADEAPAPTR